MEKGKIIFKGSFSYTPSCLRPESDTSPSATPPCESKLPIWPLVSPFNFMPGLLLCNTELTCIQDYTSKSGTAFIVFLDRIRKKRE